jgi:putative Holliday junction resolvase
VAVKEYIGLDVGLKHTGLARASTAARLAEPLMSVSTEDVVKTLRSLIMENDIDSIVIGLPRNLSGDDTSQTDWVRQWVKENKPHINKPLYWQDEALTSKVAASRQIIKKQQATADIDSLAAAIILQDFLDTPEAERVVC